jgi:5-methylcytosine-specific restriction endonuclease McrA
MVVIRGGADRADRPARHFSDHYAEYLDSPAWADTRAAALARAGHRCQSLGCGVTTGLDVHHRSYDRLGGEDWSDLLVLCRACHEAADARRRGLRRFR